MVQSTRRYFDEAHVEEFHRTAREWLSLLAFWKDEHSFMTDLINKHYVFLLSEASVDGIRQLERELNRWFAEVKGTEELVIQHEKLLAELVRNPDHPDHEEQLYRKEHEELSKKMGELEGEFRSLKARLFRYAEEALRHEKMKMLAG